MVPSKVLHVSHLQSGALRLWLGVSIMLCWEAAASDDCWSGGFTSEACCGAEFGPAGNAACWLPEADFTHERCCQRSRTPTSMSGPANDPLVLFADPLVVARARGGSSPQNDTAESSLPASSCWSEGFTSEACCHAEFGLAGNEACWLPEAGFTYERCCLPDQSPHTVSRLGIGAYSESKSAEVGPHVWVRRIGKDGSVHIQTRLHHDTERKGGDTHQLDMSQCVHRFIFATHGSLMSRYVACSGDPAGRLHAGSRSVRGNRKMCEDELRGVMWTATATVYDNAASSEAMWNFDTCVPDFCSSDEVRLLAANLVAARLDSLQLAAMSTIQVEMLSGSMTATPFGVYVGILVVAASALAAGLQMLRTPERGIWKLLVSVLSASSAFEDLTARTGESEVFGVHCLRVAGTVGQMLNHFMCFRYQRNDPSWLAMLRFLQWWICSFFVISIYLLVGACQGGLRYASFADRFCRKVQRQAVLIGVNLFLERHIFAFLEGAAISPLPSHLLSMEDGTESWLKVLLIQMAAPWQWSAELWQWLLVSLMLGAEAVGPRAAMMMWLALCMLALPMLWDASDGAIDGSREQPPFMRFWSARVPFCLLLVPVLRCWVWPRHWMLPQSWRFIAGCILAMTSGIAVSQLWFYNQPFLLEVSFSVPALLLLPSLAAPAVAKDEEHTKLGGAKVATHQLDPGKGQQGHTFETPIRTLVLIASRVSPIATLLEHRLSLVFIYICPPLDHDWRHMLFLQGPIYVVWGHVVCMLVWVFFFQPVRRSIAVLTSILPNCFVRQFLVPSILIALLYLNRRHIAASYFEDTVHSLGTVLRRVF
ncbi:unnamed protein product [Polarella glacialis]|uniref:Mannosyltransferase n=1 Tax=Polarella glacialis TaxID=89957 RepID=A0A813L081_POLGL|nr:unnamed protein product [Polarella glacialis]